MKLYGRKSFNFKRNIIICLILVISAVFLVSASLEARSASAPDFSLKDVNGKEFSLSQALKDKQKLLLFFWASWCPHCQDALKQLSKKSGSYKLVTVNIGESKDIINRFMQRHSYNFTVLVDEESSVAADYGVVGIPTFIVIEPDSSISYKDYIFPQNLE